MYRKKTIFLLTLAFLVTSCADSWDSVKRGMTGAKKESAEEFLVIKKDPLILPPDYDKLPTPDEQRAAAEDISSFEKKLKKKSSTKNTSSSTTSTEISILERIKRE